MKKLLFILISPLFVTGCFGPNEEDFKSTVVPIEKVQAMTAKEAAEEPLFAEVNYDVPFYPQAPDGDWGEPWKETCEEEG